MGAGSSSMGGAKGYSIRAQSSKRLADEILTLMFKKTDFKDLLQLTNLQACSRYVFTTASALSSLFHSMKVYPKLGKEGEILFAPVADLAPGLFKDGTTQTAAEVSRRLEVRNRLCVDIAYFYIRLFQIYGALALTVMNADPVRATVFTASSTPKTSMGTRAAPFQTGGGIVGAKSGTIASVIKTSFGDSLFKYFDTFFSASKSDDGKFYVKLVGNERRELTFPWIEGTTDTLNEGIYTVPNQPRIENLSLVVKKSGETIDLEVNNATLIRLQQSGEKYIYGKIDEDDPISESTQPKDYLTHRMRKVFGAEVAAASSAAAAKPSSGLVSIPSGKSVFEGFEELKKIYAAKTSTAGFVFPKAYCVARAMTLLNPIFPEELPKAMKIGPQPVTETQVCSATYDFETGGDQFMPRAGKTAGANLYFRSLVALFYDSYTVGGGTISFTQTETGRTKLREASSLIAKLYFVKDPAQQATFLMSQMRFSAFQLCKEKSTSRILLKPELREKILRTVVLPMLKFQEEHTAKVNALLKKMFVIKGDSLLLNAKLLQGDRSVLNSLGYEAHQLLLDYYLKSEGYYIKGVLELQNHAAQLQVL